MMTTYFQVIQRGQKDGSIVTITNPSLDSSSFGIVIPPWADTTWLYDTLAKTIHQADEKLAAAVADNKLAFRPTDGCQIKIIHGVHTHHVPLVDDRYGRLIWPKQFTDVTPAQPQPPADLFPSLDDMVRVQHHEYESTGTTASNPIQLCVNWLQNDDEYQVSVNTLTGKTTPIMVRNSTTVDALKQLYHQAGGPAPAQQRLIYQSRPWNDSQTTLGDWRVTAGSTIHMLVRFGRVDDGFMYRILMQPSPNQRRVPIASPVTISWFMRSLEPVNNVDEKLADGAVLTLTHVARSYQLWNRHHVEQPKEVALLDSLVKDNSLPFPLVVLDMIISYALTAHYSAHEPFNYQPSLSSTSLVRNDTSTIPSSTTTITSSVSSLSSTSVSTVNHNTGVVAGDVRYNGDWSWTFTPSSPLSYDAHYVASLSWPAATLAQLSTTAAAAARAMMGLGSRADSAAPGVFLFGDSQRPAGARVRPDRAAIGNVIWHMYTEPSPAVLASA